MRRLANFLLGLPFLLACGTSTAPSGGVRVAVSGTEFQAPASVRFSVRNETRQSIYVSRCGDRIVPAIERLRLGEWENAGAAICPANLPEVSAELRSGETLSDSIRLTEPGQYRVVVGYGSGVVRILYLAPSPAFLVQ